MGGGVSKHKAYADPSSEGSSEADTNGTCSIERQKSGKTIGEKRHVSEAASDDQSGRAPLPGCGHLFILHCDVRRIAADAIMVPGPDDMTSGIRRLDDALLPRKVQLVVEAAVAKDSEHKRPQEQVVDECMKQVTAFLELAGKEVSGKPSAFRRAKPLMALPVVGVGIMDASDVVTDEGVIVQRMLPILYEAIEKYHVDLAVCTIDLDAFNVMQVFRDRMCPWKGGPFWMLDDALKREANRLGGLAQSNRLSILIGAGVSLPSGLPDWDELLEDLAEKCDMSAARREALDKLDPLDQATILEHHMDPEGTTNTFRKSIAELVEASRYTPAHSLLSGLAVPAVTTNYDDLYADVSESRNKPIAVLPFDADKLVDINRSLLKLHGCIRHPDSIVITRKDYMRYADMNIALRGRVCDLLLVTEVLVVGFSMTDDHLHLIVDQGRKAMQGRTKMRMGTILTMEENWGFRELWQDDFTVLSFGNGAQTGSKDDQRHAFQQAVWRHDCFLDLLRSTLARDNAQASWILNPKYSHLLSPAEQKLARAFQNVADLRTDPEVADSAAWPAVAGLLDKLGYE